MKAALILSGVVFLVCFGAVYYWNTTSSEDIVFDPPYYFLKTNDLTSVVNAYFFVFFFTLLFFGTLAPIAWGIEGLKYGALISSFKIAWFDLLFIIPQILATYSAILLGISLNNDLQGKTNFFQHWNKAAMAFFAGLAAMGLFLILKNYVVIPF